MFLLFTPLMQGKFAATHKYYNMKTHRELKENSNIFRFSVRRGLASGSDFFSPGHMPGSTLDRQE